MEEDLETYSDRLMDQNIFNTIQTDVSLNLVNNKQLKCTDSKSLTSINAVELMTTVIGETITPLGGENKATIAH